MYRQKNGTVLGLWIREKKANRNEITTRASGEASSIFERTKRGANAGNPLKGGGGDFVRATYLVVEGGK